MQYLSSWPGIKPTPPAVEMRSLNHRMARETPLNPPEFMAFDELFEWNQGVLMLGEEGCFHLISSSEVWSEAPGFPGGASIKDSTYQCRRQGLIPVLGRSPGGGHGNLLQYSCPESPMGRGAWRATVHGVTRTRSWLKQLSTHAHSEVPGFPRWCSGKESACQCKRCERRSFSLWVEKIPWRRKWQPVFLPGKFHGQRSLAGYSPWGCKESETTLHTHTHRGFWSWNINTMKGTRGQCL